MNKSKLREQIRKTRSKMTRGFLEQFKISEFVIQALLKRVDYTIDLCIDEALKTQRKAILEEVRSGLEKYYFDVTDEATDDDCKRFADRFLEK